MLWPLRVVRRARCQLPLYLAADRVGSVPHRLPVVLQRVFLPERILVKLGAGVAGLVGHPDHDVGVLDSLGAFAPPIQPSLDLLAAVCRRQHLDAPPLPGLQRIRRGNRAKERMHRPGPVSEARQVFPQRDVRLVEPFLGPCLPSHLLLVLVPAFIPSRAQPIGQQAACHYTRCSEPAAGQQRQVRVHG
jgi:hypothetical protein